MLKITLLCTDRHHPIFAELEAWQANNKHKFDITLCNSINQVMDKGNLLFLISCLEIISAEQRSHFDHTLVLHASDLPKNRGWSPHIWSIISGENKITLSLLEAQDKVDTGAIWKKTDIHFNGTELYDDINRKLFAEQLNMVTWACDNFDSVIPTEQSADHANYLPKRTPADSELDIKSSLEEQFNLLRVCDPNRFPAYFYMKGCKYKIKIEKY